MSKQRELSRAKRHHRVRAKVSGSSERPRLCVHRSLKNIHAQIVDDDAGRTLVSCSTQCKEVASKLTEDGCGAATVAAAKIVGRCLAEKAKDAGIGMVKFDRGGYLYHGRVKALAEGAREAGLAF